MKTYIDQCNELFDTALKYELNDTKGKWRNIKTGKLVSLQFLSIREEDGETLCSYEPTDIMYPDSYYRVFYTKPFEEFVEEYEQVFQTTVYGNVKEISELKKKGLIQ